MRQTRLLAIPVIMFFILACGLSNGIQQIQSAVTQLPGVLTSMPTELGGIETAASAQTSSDCTTTTPGGLGITLDKVKLVLQLTQQVTFTDGTVNGLPVSTATLSSTSASAFPSISNGFSAQFIGDPCNLSEIKVTAPRTDQQSTVDEGIAVLNILFAGFMPPEVDLPLLTWLTQNYGNVPVSGQAQISIGQMQFTLQRSKTNTMTLDILPVK
jgi:hypothetical protein